MKERRKRGLANLSKSRDYLAYSRSVGRDLKKSNILKLPKIGGKSVSGLVGSSSMVRLSKSIGSGPVGKIEEIPKNKNFLAENQKFAEPIIRRKRRKLSLNKNIFLKKRKIPKKSEFGNLEREAKWKHYKLRNSPKQGVERLLET